MTIIHTASLLWDQIEFFYFEEYTCYEPQLFECSSVISVCKAFLVVKIT